MSSNKLISNRAFDVHILEVKLIDRPASIITYYRVGHLNFYSQITYLSIPGWNEFKAKVNLKSENPLAHSKLITTIVLWDAMRFMALGGERLILPKDFPCDDFIAKKWQYCFYNQLSEWRYRNNFHYKNNLPELVYTSTVLDAHVEKKAPLSNIAPKILLTNGGGKDSLTGMLLLNNAHISYDLYESSLPCGGDQKEQDFLLEKLGSALTQNYSKTKKVIIKDNFFSTPDEVFENSGVSTKHYKSDFAVGHTANYAGYYPVILFHDYTDVWFNIEKSADRTMVLWNEESINHQWCKSTDYQYQSNNLFRHLFPNIHFNGFKSTIRGLSDISIYTLVSQHPHLLLLTHSCNNEKPWCNRCPKCLFCYLMMTAFIDEQYAQEVTGVSKSLFSNSTLLDIWDDLLDPERVSWECVPSSEESKIAVYMCIQQNLNYPILKKHAPSLQVFNSLLKKYAIVDYCAVPPQLHNSLRQMLTINRSSIQNRLTAN
jgi:UDP-N-acetyl-alpha-D-muramoyl-L-alanyl-L-glutamate epimerase